MDSRNTAHSGIVGLLALVAAATAGLHALGNVPAFAVDLRSPLTWLDTSDPCDVIGALVRYVGLGIGYWVLVTTTLYYGVTLSGRGPRPRWLRLVTLPPIQRMIDRTLAASLAISIVATPVASLRAEESTPTPPPVVFEVSSDGIPVPHIGTAERDQEEGDSAPYSVETDSVAPEPLPPQEDPASPAIEPVPPAPEVSLPVVVSGGVATPSVATTVEYTVERGDNLWSIAANHLANLIGPDPSLTQVDGYWRTVIAANRDTLRSGDPNLIYPGEIITLPAPGTAQ